MTNTSSLRWGFLGTGWIADVLTSDMALIGLKPHAIASRSLDNAQQFASARGIELAFGSYEELCASDEIDVVYIATPHPFHFDNAMLALNNGKHVLVEKAFTMNALQAKILIEKAKEKNLFLMEAMWSRFLPAQIAMKKAIADGEIGDLQAITAEHSQNLPHETHARLWEIELGGGALLDLGVYPAALIQNVMGTPQSIRALGSLATTGADKLVQVGFSYDDGKRVGSMLTTQTVAGPANATIYGTKGRIEIHKPLWGQFEFSVFDVYSELVRTYSEEVIGTGRHLQVQEVNEAISQGLLEHQLMSHADTLSVMETMDEIRRQLGVVYPADSSK
jgi:predicted dehydrogenase